MQHVKEPLLEVLYVTLILTVRSLAPRQEHTHLLSMNQTDGLPGSTAASQNNEITTTAPE
jgi:hypothetical protein